MSGVCEVQGERCYHPISCEERGCVKQRRSPVALPANCATGLEATIALFKHTLPGWWFTIGECDVSCDASCAPTRHSPDIRRIERPGDQWDAGFHVDLPQPSSLAAALADVMVQAVTAIAEAEGLA